MEKARSFSLEQWKGYCGISRVSFQLGLGGGGGVGVWEKLGREK